MPGWHRPLPAQEQGRLAALPGADQLPEQRKSGHCRYLICMRPPAHSVALPRNSGRGFADEARRAKAGRRSRNSIASAPLPPSATPRSCTAELLHPAAGLGPVRWHEPPWRRRQRRPLGRHLLPRRFSVQPGGPVVRARPCSPPPSCPGADTRCYPCALWGTSCAGPFSWGRMAHRRRRRL